MSIDVDQVLDWRGSPVVDRDGRKVGTFHEVYLDEGTSAPTWAAVKTGPLGLRRRVVPIVDAESDGTRVRIPFTKEQVLSAPTIDAEGWVPESDRSIVLRHYGINASRRQGDGNRAARVSPDEAVDGVDPAAASNPSGESQDRPSDRELKRFRLKRHTVTETVTRRSEFEEDQSGSQAR
jgi:sporulation protein YlmC with PRC-barrel domain